jgi:hypothetical protein
MGCDIHVVLEKKFGGKWIGMRELSSMQIYLPVAEDNYAKRYVFCNASSRNYGLFARLAGVRGEGPEPKGMPEDASELARALYDNNSDLHSHSWCTLEEYLEHLVAASSSPARVLLTDSPEMKDPYVFFFNMYPPEDDEEYRVVFAFDN